MPALQNDVQSYLSLLQRTRQQAQCHKTSSSSASSPLSTSMASISPTQQQQLFLLQNNLRLQQQQQHQNNATLVLQKQQLLLTLVKQQQLRLLKQKQQQMHKTQKSNNIHTASGVKVNKKGFTIKVDSSTIQGDARLKPQGMSSILYVIGISDLHHLTTAFSAFGNIHVTLCKSSTYGATAIIRYQSTVEAVRAVAALQQAPNSNYKVFYAEDPLTIIFMPIHTPVATHTKANRNANMYDVTSQNSNTTSHDLPLSRSQSCPLQQQQHHHRHHTHIPIADKHSVRPNPIYSPTLSTRSTVGSVCSSSSFLSSSSFMLDGSLSLTPTSLSPHTRKTFSSLPFSPSPESSTPSSASSSTQNSPRCRTFLKSRVKHVDDLNNNSNNKNNMDTSMSKKACVAKRERFESNASTASWDSNISVSSNNSTTRNHNTQRKKYFSLFTSPSLSGRTQWNSTSTVSSASPSPALSSTPSIW